MTKIYAVGAAFYDRGGWSKIYTYKSTIPIQEGSTVIVPYGQFYKLAKVCEVREDYEFRNDINYKHIHSVIDL